MHEVSWDTDAIISPNFTLTKIETDINSWIHTLPADSIDVVYFDAFAPEKQPEMWSPQLFEQNYNAMRHNGILTTDYAQVVVRRRPQSAWFMVERMPGPPGGKREILRANKL